MSSLMTMQRLGSRKIWRKKNLWLSACVLLSVLVLSLLVFRSPWYAPSQWLVFTGRFHPVFLHLPIGMLILVFLMEIQSLFVGQHARTLMPLVATVTFSCLAAVLGYVLMRANTYPADAINSHFFSGVAFTVALIWTLFFKARVSSTRKGQGIYWFFLLLSISLMGATGHYGGLITHGDPFDDAPWVKTSQSLKSPKKIDERLIYEDIIIPIFEEKCIKCHGPKKKKGGLRMDSYEAMLEGGDEGICLTPGEPENSLMIEYIHLPLDDEYRMPPEKKPQLTEAEVSLIEWWVKVGAPRQTKVGEIDVPRGMKLLESH